MLKLNLKLIIAMSLVCTGNVLLNGMKRNMLIEHSLPGEPWPQEVLEEIFTYLCHIPINAPLVSESGIFSELNNIYHSHRYRCPHKRQLHIAPDGIVAWLATMRSVCTNWRDNVLSYAKIKHLLNIDCADIIADLTEINATSSSRNHFYVQFLAKMINGQNNVCNHLLFDIIYHDNDPDKLKIFLENDLVDPNCYLSGKNLLYPSPLGCCFNKRTSSWMDDNDSYEYSYIHCHEKSFRILLDHKADVYQAIDNKRNILDFLLFSTYTASSINTIIKIIAEKVQFTVDYQDRILKRSAMRTINDENETEVCCRGCCLLSTLSTLILFAALVGSEYIL